MTCTIMVNTLREISEETKKTATALEAVALDRWLTEGGSTEDEVAQEAPKPLLTAQNFEITPGINQGQLERTFNQRFLNSITLARMIFLATTRMCKLKVAPRHCSDHQLRISVYRRRTHDVN